MRKVLSLALTLAMFTAPAYADFAALERSSASGNIINDILPEYYADQDGTPLTESSIASLTTEGYAKTGLTADGNTRLILRYQAPSAGNVAFSLSANMSDTKLESLTDRQTITSPLRTTQIDNVHQASAVLTAPETWPSSMNYPHDTFTVTASFTPDNGDTVQETLTLTLAAPSVVLIHGPFSDNADTFGYDDPTNSSGVWHKLEDAGLSIISWNYDGKKGPKTIINNKANPLAKTLIDAFDSLNAKGIASTRADIVSHSTGGLVARQFLRNDFDTGNKSALSYKQGMIRRVVTIAAPNLGTPIASFFREEFKDIGAMWQNWKAKNFWQGLGHTLLNIFANKNGKFNDVFEDIAINSSLIAQLGYPEIPFHSIYGKIAVDNDKIAELFKLIMAYDKVKIKKLTWLPPQFVDMLLSTNGLYVSVGLNLTSKDARCEELLTVMFNGEDHDVIVSEKSAVDIFPEYARTAFEGLVNHNHIMLAKQDDVASRVLELLKGDTSNFMIHSGVSTAQYDRAFDEYVTELAPKFRASIDDLREIFDNELGLETSEMVNRPGNGAAGNEEQFYDIDLSGSSSQVFSDDIYVLLKYPDGKAKFFTLSGSNSSSFTQSLEFDDSNAGIVELTYFTVINGKLKVSKTEQLVIPPKLPNVDGIKFTANKIYMHEGEESKLELIAQTPKGNYDIAAPLLGITKFTVSDPAIASISDTGYVSGLKEGTTEITAKVGIYTESITVEVLPAVASSSNNEQTASSSGGSSGGCNAGFGALVVLAACAFIINKR